MCITKKVLFIIVFPVGDYCHRRFRWAAESPSTLLQRFRNYEI